MRTLWAGILFLALSLSGTAGWADVSLFSRSQLLAHGIDSDSFSIVEFSPDGRSLLGYQQAPPADVHRGLTWRLFLLQLRSDGRISDVRAYDLAIPRLEQAAFTPDGREVVMITASGAAFVVLDLDSGQVRTLMAHEPRKAGFRAQPAVLWRAEGRLLARGYFYDEEDYGGDDAIAEVDTTKTGMEAFRLAGDLAGTQQLMKDVAIYAYTGPQAGFFCTVQKGRQSLHHWVGGKPPVTFDEAAEVTGFMPHGDQLAYAVKRAEGKCEVLLFDGATGSRRVLGTSETPFGYLTFSMDGSAVQVNQIRGDRFTLFSASSRSGWALRPLAGLTRAQAGEIRLSSDGKRMALKNSEGVRIADLP